MDAISKYKIVEWKVPELLLWEPNSRTGELMSKLIKQAEIISRASRKWFSMKKAMIKKDFSKKSSKKSRRKLSTISEPENGRIRNPDGTKNFQLSWSRDWAILWQTSKRFNDWRFYTVYGLNVGLFKYGLYRALAIYEVGPYVHMQPAIQGCNGGDSYVAYSALKTAGGKKKVWVFPSKLTTDFAFWLLLWAGARGACRKPPPHTLTQEELVRFCLCLSL